MSDKAGGRLGLFKPGRRVLAMIAADAVPCFGFRFGLWYPMLFRTGDLVLISLKELSLMTCGEPCEDGEYPVWKEDEEWVQETSEKRKQRRET